MYSPRFSSQLLTLGVLLCSQFVLKNLSFDVSLFQNRLHGTFGNPNFAGGYLAMLFSYILFWNKSNSFIYKIKPVILLLGGVGIVLTDSRSAILAVVIVVIIYFLTLAFRIGKYRLFISSLLLLSIVSSLFLILNYSFHARRISEWENRSIIWTEGIRLIEKRPILGYGQEAVSIVFPEHLHFTVDNMHNIFLEYAISAGVVGSIAFLGLLFFAWRNLNGPGRFMIIAFLITGSLNPLSISQLVLLWVVIGIGKNSL
jgi:O-antigen ligase